jgi:hypothetical protein
MTFRLLPTPTNGYPDTSFRVALDGATWPIRWLWNQRDRAWTFSMWDPDGVPLLLGVRVVADANLLAWADATRRPTYPIVVCDPSGKGGEPSLETLGSQHKVVYLDLVGEEAMLP